MLLLCLGILIAILLVCMVLWCCREKDYRSENKFRRWCYHHDDGIGCTAIVCGVFAGILLLATVIVGGSYSEVISIDEKIAMYQEENAQIETDIDEIVSAYLSHEQTIMENAKPPESVTAILLTYPELNSNTMVTKQIEIYADNNAQIKTLKAEKLNLQVLRWWLFF